MSLWTKIRLIFSPTFWRTRIITKVREFFTKLFDVKPKHKRDYYSLGNWLVSKKLAFAAVVILAVLCIVIIVQMSPKFIASASGNTVSSYMYDSFPLKFKKGVVQILGKGKYIAYVGNVEEGYASGSGKLNNKDEILVYEGMFGNSMFNGQGKLFYPDGVLKYQGTFVDNEYDGSGTEYSNSGTTEYSGNFKHGKKNGTGELYDQGGNKIYAGNFLDGQLLFTDFLGKTTTEASQMYSGSTSIYNGGAEYAVEMTDINSIYSTKDAANSLEQEWIVNQICVAEDSITLGGKEITTVNDLTAYFGKPIYTGSTWLTLPEAVAVNLSVDQGTQNLGKVDINKTVTFDEVFDVRSYDKNYEIYIYVYKLDGLLYTFNCLDGGKENFFTYSIALDK